MLGNRELLDLIERYDTAVISEAMDELLDRAERLTRAAIEEIPDGTYRFVDYLDNDGINPDRRVRIEVSITIDGSEFCADLTGSEPQVAGPINCVPASTLAADLLRAAGRHGPGDP